MGRRSKKRGSEEATVDLTPMIDVVFQMIIFFIVTANLDQESFNKDITLPDAPNAITQKEREMNQITIQVDGTGNVYLGSGSPVQAEELKRILENAARRTRGGANNIPLLIRGDRDTTHEHIRALMNTCGRAGFYKIRFAGLQTEGSG